MFKILLLVSLLVAFVKCHEGHDHEEHHDLDRTHLHSQLADDLHHHHEDDQEYGSTRKHVHSFGSYLEQRLTLLNNSKLCSRVLPLVSVLVISIAPFVILFFIPIQSNNLESNALLRVLLSFGAGGLLGDAFLHLIPHASSSHTHHSHSHMESDVHGPHDMSAGVWVLAGFIVFLAIEKGVRSRRGDEHGHEYAMVSKSDEGRVDKKANESQVAAYLNIAADFAHNFTDGLAIGASFSAGTSVGLITTLTVFVHEVPHEIGDFAILIKSGFSKRKAIMIQLLTAGGALAGCLLSMIVTETNTTADSLKWILPFTAGGFIYIAAVSIVPDLLLKKTSFLQSNVEFLALLLGIVLMYAVALFE